MQLHTHENQGRNDSENTGNLNYVFLTCFQVRDFQSQTTSALSGGFKEELYVGLCVEIPRDETRDRYYKWQFHEALTSESFN
jgi:hypothetical protein